MRSNWVVRRTVEEMPHPDSDTRCAGHDPSISYADILSAILSPSDPPSRDLDVTVWRGEPDGSVGLSLAGVMDLATVPSLSRTVSAMTPTGIPMLTLDLDGVTHLDACGLGLIVAIRKRMVGRGDQLRLTYARGGQSHRAMRMTHLDEVFPPAA